MSNVTDTRPRLNYRLPDGTIVAVIHDHGEQPRSVIDFTLAGGRVVLAFCAEPFAVRPEPAPRDYGDRYKALRKGSI